MQSSWVRRERGRFITLESYAPGRPPKRPCSGLQQLQHRTRMATARGGSGPYCCCSFRPRQMLLLHQLHVPSHARYILYTRQWPNMHVPVPAVHPAVSTWQMVSNWGKVMARYLLAQMLPLTQSCSLAGPAFIRVRGFRGEARKP